MAELILVKHSLPTIVSRVPSRQWLLSEEGVRRCDWLANALMKHGVVRIVSSAEPKAEYTAVVVAKALGLENMVYPGLHENDRTNFPLLPHDQFEQRLKSFFAKPDQTTIGRESATHAQRRFAGEIDLVLQGREDTTAVIAHGTVNTLFTALHNPIEPFDLWASLKLPSYLVLDQHDFSWDGQVYNHPDA